MRPVVDDQRAAILAAILFTAAAAWCWRDAYTRRGKDRPLWSRVLGLVS